MYLAVYRISESQYSLSIILCIYTKLWGGIESELLFVKLNNYKILCYHHYRTHTL